ncbi:zinc finger CCCH-type antiviral protein 1-like isoform X5 [Plectropomus leopardus]|uniref:zinc finger CCCH-type antiviral protein 1-like isoform X5 n=1 Tax=Plectropomus leopardus TaxID=160734 RepID=UPI001C4A9750|nr:zinc finger CCCH-type antiviral protein 1-like isoform X5 [Plectropomus leopardus]
MASAGQTWRTWRTWSGTSVTRPKLKVCLSVSVCVFSHGDPPVHFPSMTQKLRPVRRLSTVSSVTKPLHYVLTTKWRWFYRGDGGVWVEYGEPDEKLRTMSVTSRRLEEAFLSDPSAEVLVVKGNREYVVSFTDMYQRNLKHHTKRRIRRRPHFVSTAEVENLHKNFDPMWI